MTTQQYLAALKKLGLSHPRGESEATSHTAAALGCSPRQAIRYASGETAIPKRVEMLLELREIQRQFQTAPRLRQRARAALRAMS